MWGEGLQGLHCSPQGLGSEFPIVPRAGQGPERAGASPDCAPPSAHQSGPTSPASQPGSPHRPTCISAWGGGLPGSHHSSMAWARTRPGLLPPPKATLVPVTSLEHGDLTQGRAWHLAHTTAQWRDPPLEEDPWTPVPTWSLTAPPGGSGRGNCHLASLSMPARAPVQLWGPHLLSQQRLLSLT